MIYELLLRNLTNSIYGGLLVAVVVLIRLAVRRRVSKSYICILWILVGLRLIIPASIESPVGILPQISLGHSRVLETEDHYYSEEPTGPVFDESDGSSAHDIESAATETEISVQGDAEYITVASVQKTKINIPEIVWLAGCVLMLGYMAITWMITGRKVRFAVPESFRIHIKPSDATDSEVRIYSTEDIRVPFLFGLVKPKIYLPYGLTENDRVHVIRHELAHIRRCDHITKPAFFAILAFYWYNPLIWLAFILFSSDMEMACDELVVDSYDESARNGYADALLSVAGKNRGIRMFSIPFGSAPIKERISRVMSYKRNGWVIKVSSIIVIAILSMFFSSVHATADQGETVITDYDLVVPVIDEATGERFLLIPYYKDLNAYELVESGDELETKVRENSDMFWYERPLSDYQIRKDAATGLEYIVKNGDALWESHVLLRDDHDRKIYDSLARDYSDRYTEVIPDAEVGYIYASYEVMGLAERYDNGFLFLQTGTLMYIDLRDPVAYGWRLALTTDEYLRLEKWMSERKDSSFDHTDFEAWKPVLDELDIEYDITLDPESKRYQGAVRWLENTRAKFPAEGMSDEQIEEQIRYTIKSFDEDGDEVPFGTVPGMLVTEENDKDRKTIIQIPDDIRQMMFDLNKEEFIKWNGCGGDTERSDVYRTYQEQAPKGDRLKGTWTLSQYERLYINFFVEAVKSANPEWQPGDDFDDELINAITRDQIETYIYVDGSELKYDPAQFVTEESCVSESPDGQ